MQQIKGLNIDAIRNLNKIRVYGVKSNETDAGADIAGVSVGIKPIFEAYLTSPVGSLKAGVQSDSLTQQVGEYVKKLKPFASIATSAIGTFLKDEGNKGLMNFVGSAFDLANEINYNYHWRYNGTNEFRHTLQCELVVKDDFIDDVIIPLWSLLEYVMPNETDTMGETAIYQSASEEVKKFYEFLKQSAKEWNNKYIDSNAVKKLTSAAGNFLDEKISRWGSVANDILSSISVMEKPIQLRDYSHTRILIGDYIVLDDIIIDNVDFNIPYLFYEGGLFDKVTLSLTLKGTRKMSLKTYDWIRGIARNQTFKDRKTLRSIPLNSRFE